LCCSINLKKADVTPAQRLDAYAETGSYMAQKYFGSPTRKMKADQANQILGFDAEGKSSHGVPLSNYMNAQVWTVLDLKSGNRENQERRAEKKKEGQRLRCNWPHHG